MTIEEQKEKVLKKINALSKDKLIYLIDFLEKIENQDEKYIDESKFEQLLKEDLEQYKEVWKELA
jgi:aryl-phospho-beta-D-glucosidase BglC (GH1 family)